MAVKRVDSSYIQDGENVFVGILEFQGLSTDTKPILTEFQSGSQFFELDTSSIFIWNIDGWVEL